MTSRAERLQRLRAMTASGEARAIRLDARLSIADVAQDVGVHVSTISLWERGERTPHGDVALAYLRLLDKLASAAVA